MSLLSGSTHSDLLAGNVISRVVIRTISLIVVISGAACLLFAQPAVHVDVYPTDQAGRIAVGPDGALWFTESVAGKIGRITTSGVITEYAIPTASGYPYGIVAGSDGALWFTELQAPNIGRITTDGSVTEYPVGRNPSPNITAGPDGALWFTRHCWGISRITTAGSLSDYPTTSCPFGITTGPDGALWFADMYRVGRITSEGTVTSFPVPNYGFQSIAVGSDKALWFTGSLITWPKVTSPTIGRITTAGTITKYPLPDDQFFAFLIAAGPDGALWFTEATTNSSLGRISTSGAFTTVPVGAPCRYGNNQFNGIVLGPDRALWLSCNNGNIVRVSLADNTAPAITVRPEPKSLWPPNGRVALVTVTGTITDTETGVAQNSVEYSVLDEYRQVQPSGHVRPDSAGNYSFRIFLPASREGNDKDGRRYYIRVTAQDNAGNRGSTWTNVVVPHERR